MKIEIKGLPYNVTRNTQGYGVVPMTELTDHFYRAYQVNTDQHGKPISCSCPDYTHRKIPSGMYRCKHMLALDNIIINEGVQS
jgi:hypothetical protein